MCETASLCFYETSASGLYITFFCFWSNCSMGSVQKPLPKSLIWGTPKMASVLLWLPFDTAKQIAPSKPKQHPKHIPSHLKRSTQNKKGLPHTKIVPKVVPPQTTVAIFCFATHRKGVPKPPADPLRSGLRATMGALAPSTERRRHAKASESQGSRETPWAPLGKGSPYSNMDVAQKTGIPKWNPGKWKHGPKSA